MIRQDSFSDSPYLKSFEDLVLNDTDLNFSGRSKGKQKIDYKETNTERRYYNKYINYIFMKA